MGEAVFSSLLFGWRVGMFFVKRRNAQSGENGCFDLLVVDRKGCRVRGLRSMDYGGELLVGGGGLNCRNLDLCRLRISSRWALGGVLNWQKVRKEKLGMGNSSSTLSCR